MSDGAASSQLIERFSESVSRIARKTSRRRQRDVDIDGNTLRTKRTHEIGEPIFQRRREDTGYDIAALLRCRAGTTLGSAWPGPSLNESGAGQGRRVLLLLIATVDGGTDETRDGENLDFSWLAFGDDEFCNSDTTMRPARMWRADGCRRFGRSAGSAAERTKAASTATTTLPTKEWW